MFSGWPGLAHTVSCLVETELANALQFQAQVCEVAIGVFQGAGSFCAGLNLASGQACTALPGANRLA